MNKKRKKIIIIGGIGNGSVIAAAINQSNHLNKTHDSVIGYVNDRSEKGSKIEEIPVLGSLGDIKKYLQDPDVFFINTILKIGGQEKRIDLFNALNIPEERMYTFIHHSAYIPRGVVIGHGSVIMPNTSISPGVKIGKNSLIMVSCVIGHNSTISDFCHIAAGACVGSFVNVKSGVHLGLNCTIKENITINDNSVLGMGSVLTKDIDKEEIWIGSPAKFLKKSG